MPNKQLVSSPPKQSVKPKSDARTQSAIRNVAPYTAEEKQWLKKHYGDEYHFLMSFGWKIHDEQDRAEGRAVLRAFMEKEEEEAGTRRYYDLTKRMRTSTRSPRTTWRAIWRTTISTKGL
jgi:hypothetical protein